MLRAIRDASRRNNSWEVRLLEVAQGMDSMCAQKQWATTAVLLCTPVQQ